MSRCPSIWYRVARQTFYGLQWNFIKIWGHSPFWFLVKMWQQQTLGMKTYLRYYVEGICDSIGGDVNVGFVGCNVVWTCTWVPIFRKNTLPSFAVLRLGVLESGGLYRVTEGYGTLFKEVLVRSFWAEILNKYFVFIFATVCELRRSYIYIAFIIEIFDFLQVETVRHNITRQLIFLFAMKWTKKSKVVLCNFFSRYFRAILLKYSSVRVVGTCQHTACT